MPAVIKGAVQGAHIVHILYRAAHIVLNGAGIVAHVQKQNSCAFGILLFVSLCLSVQAVIFVHAVYLRVFSVKFQFVDDSVFTALVQHLNRRAVKDISAGLAELGKKAFAVIAGGEPMIQLIFDFRVKAVGLHLGHHTGQAYDVGVVLVAYGSEFRAELNIPFQLGKVLERHGLRRFCFVCHQFISIP